MTNESKSNELAEGAPVAPSVPEAVLSTDPAEAARIQARATAAERLANDPHAVDMFAVARVAQETAAAPFKTSGSVKLVAPAKVNLYLDIGDKRPDGYHEAVSIMHALALHDVIRMRLVPEDPFALVGTMDSALESDEGSASSEQLLTIDLTCRACEGIRELDVAPEDNIVSKAIRLLAAEIGRECCETMRVDVEKHIPSEAGLGGGSADAAAALVGAARLWGLEADDARLEDVARRLGADVAFFLHGGCACLTGVGDVFDHALEPMRSFVVLVKPEGGVSTAAAYESFDACHERIPDSDRARALEARRAQDVPLRNNLAGPSERLLPVLAEVRTWAANHPDVEEALMSGSGSAVFALCPTFEAAARVAMHAQARGWWARSTMFGPMRAAAVPSW